MTLRSSMQMANSNGGDYGGNGRPRARTALLVTVGNASGRLSRTTWTGADSTDGGLKQSDYFCSKGARDATEAKDRRVVPP